MKFARGSCLLIWRGGMDIAFSLALIIALEVVFLDPRAQEGQQPGRLNFVNYMLCSSTQSEETMKYYV